MNLRLGFGVGFIASELEVVICGGYGFVEPRIVGIHKGSRWCK